jgi:hypothetical protein
LAGNGQWQAVSDISWLTVALGAAGAGQGSVFIVADPYSNVNSARTGTVTAAGQKVYVTQRGSQLSISPEVAQIGSNAGAGEFGVAAHISSVWEAIATQPWITIVGGAHGIGSGTLRYAVAINDTGVRITPWATPRSTAWRVPKTDSGGGLLGRVGAGCLSTTRRSIPLGSKGAEVEGHQV